MPFPTSNNVAFFVVVVDDVMEHIDGAVKVSEITELLRTEYGVVTGENIMRTFSLAYF